MCGKTFNYVKTHFLLKSVCHYLLNVNQLSRFPKDNIVISYINLNVRFTNAFC